MYYNPHTHLALAKARQDDLRREADRRRLANLVTEGRPSTLARLRKLVSERSWANRHPAPAAG